MQSQFYDRQPFEVPFEVNSGMLNPVSSLMDADNAAIEAASTNETTRFHTHFESCMEMYADAETVAKYLDTHHGWFCRCAHPMQVEPLGENGYALVIGRFGAFGYEVEPKIGLELLPRDQGVYRVRTVPVPNYVTPGYDVDYESAMTLVEVPADRFAPHQVSAITYVEWHLDLSVYIQFPKFIHKLPKSVIQNTGDRLLAQIVRQVSKSLTPKVQEDFHASLGLPVPKKSKKRAND